MQQAIHEVLGEAAGLLVFFVIPVVVLTAARVRFDRWRSAR